MLGEVCSYLRVDARAQLRVSVTCTAGQGYPADARIDTAGESNQRPR
jgi:hypothetical protein